VELVRARDGQLSPIMPANWYQKQQPQQHKRYHIQLCLQQWHHLQLPCLGACQARVVLC
jgi:hypothetical protein